MTRDIDDGPLADGASANVQLTTISAAKLLGNDPQTQKDLLEACKDLGFFYLDCRDHPSSPVLSLVAEMASTALDFYDLPESIKENYKPAGKQEGAVKGKKDGWEGIILMEHPLAQIPPEDPMPGPPVIQNARGLIEATQDQLGEMSRAIVDSLSRSLHMTGDQSLGRHHRKGCPAPTDLEILKYLPYVPGSEKVGHIPHTDLGSVSMVFSDVGGLQVFHPLRKEWMFVPPRPGHAVCNLGDAMEFLSGNVLRSSLHRVIPYTQDPGKIKLSIIHFLRPSEHTKIVSPDGKEWTVAEWNTMKHKLLHEGGEMQKNLSIITRREGQDDFWREQAV
ncbi:putative gibberellin 3-beta hydroxylase [Aspergillus campestris IBT 28561]|uniref:Gibberellin 3-beta hydroxylase n=1 Tax=Aspergillus campestris (strain IBT 28561) TaxID=1392248 RepID=A0A2I1D401_ASPC2|nr:putative gibberellin 3-beta hydroxylase [Aspergillus campestris IBT 28561]PKY04607.1 putative gibberellin 3-beta hydroxylase [Aspergillus campestris IBT 28561]